MAKNKNTLDPIEKMILNSLNFANGTKYKAEHLADWSNSEHMVKDNLREGEIMYTILGYYVAINPKGI